MEEIEYINLTEAAEAIGVSRTSIKKALDSGKLIQKLYHVYTKKKEKYIYICKMDSEKLFREKDLGFVLLKIRLKR